MESMSHRAALHNACEQRESEAHASCYGDGTGHHIARCVALHCGSGDGDRLAVGRGLPWHYKEDSTVRHSKICHLNEDG